MTKDITDKVADSLLALMPLYHRYIFRAGQTRYSHGAIPRAGVADENRLIIHVGYRQNPLHLQTLNDHAC